MRSKSILVVAMFLMFFVVHLAPAGPTLHNTGEAGGGIVETNYILTYAANLEDTPVAMTAFGLESTHPSWVVAPDDSLWISTTKFDTAAGYYFYTLDFSISGLTSISGRWATDNYGEIFLNGETTGITKGFEGFWSLADFNITSGFTGNDTLVFRVWNTGISNTGLLVTDMTPAVIPAPSAILLGSIGVGCVSWLLRRKRML